MALVLENGFVHARKNVAFVPVRHLAEGRGTRRIVNRFHPNALLRALKLVK
ncbi:MAG TPA: hypothetical protein VE964_02050 [Myxococcales bacterium]|nr:hypothetical protein [Myxococcales bacterium]